MNAQVPEPSVPPAGLPPSAVIGALLEEARAAWSAASVALAARAPAGWTIVQSSGADWAGGPRVPAALPPGVAAVTLPAPGAGLPPPAATLLVRGGTRAAEPPALRALSALLAVLPSGAVTPPATEPSTPLPAPPEPARAESQALLQAAVDRVRELLHADLAGVALREGPRTLTWRALSGGRGGRGDPVPADIGLAARVMARGRPETVTVGSPNGDALPGSFPAMRAEDIATGLGVPLLLDGEATGALLVGWRQPCTVRASEQQLVQALADQVVGVLALARLHDTTSRQRAFLERLIENVPAGIVVFDLPDLRVRLANRYYLRFLEPPGPADQAELRGRTLEEALPQATEGGTRALFERAAATGEAVTANEFEFHGFARGVTYWDWSVVPLRATPDEPVGGLLLVMVESTAQVLVRRRLAAALAATRKQAVEREAIIQQMVEGVAVVDGQGRIVNLNAAGVAMLGRDITAGSSSGDRARDLQLYDVRGVPFAPEQLPLERARRGETVIGADVLVRLPDRRERVLSVSAAPLFDEAQEISGAVSVFHDVTKAREVERVKDEFLAIVSHELRTPLAAIMGYSDLMLRGHGGPLTSKQRRNQLSVKQNATQLLGLINDLLDVSKLEAHRVTLDRQPVALQMLIPRAVASVHVPAAERGVAVSHDIPADLPAILGDEDRLHQVLTNLLSNAIKFTAAGGQVRVVVRPTALPAHAEPVPAEPVAGPAGSVLVSVTDTGVGIGTEQLARIWDRFYQADSTSSRRYGGTGLGLAIVKNLVELHGGRVWASSPGVGQGSTFLFRLPRAPEGAIPAEPAAPGEAQPDEPGPPAAPGPGAAARRWCS